jgi:hypothetical protein
MQLFDVSEFDICVQEVDGFQNGPIMQHSIQFCYHAMIKTLLLFVYILFRATTLQALPSNIYVFVAPCMLHFILVP